MKFYYAPCCKHLVWHYSNTNTEAINSVESFNWKNAFNGKDIHAEVALINKTILKVFTNFIPNSTKICTGILLG